MYNDLSRDSYLGVVIALDYLCSVMNYLYRDKGTHVDVESQQGIITGKYTDIYIRQHTYACLKRHADDLYRVEHERVILYNLYFVATSEKSLSNVPF